MGNDGAAKDASGTASKDAAVDAMGSTILDAAGDSSNAPDAPGEDAETSDASGFDATMTGGNDGSTSDAATDATVSDGGSADANAGPTDAASDQQSDGNAPVVFSIDVTRGPARQFAPPALPATVSSYIYGINSTNSSGVTSSLVPAKTHWGMIRKGGDPYTDWNWTNNYTNLGDHECFWQGQAPGGSALAGAVTGDTDSISAAQAKGEAYLTSVAIEDHLSGPTTNNTLTGALCPASASDCNGGTAPSTGVNSNGLDFASVDPSSTAFVANAAQKPGGAFCTCAPGQTCDAGCTVSTNPVYQDEYVNYLKTTFGSGGAPIFFDVGNEPNYLGSVHAEIWPFMGTLPCQTYTVTFDDIVSRDEAYAAAVKGAWPATKVFGPAVAQDGLIYAHSYASDPHYPTEFLDYYLGQMATASADAGTPLLDALDVHYYNSGTTVPSQCVENPRMFWDPNYTSLDPTDTDSIDFAYSGLNDYFDNSWYPRQVVPRLLGKIATAYGSATTAPGVSFSEYNSGCETQIAGAVAEADNLGIFGREGVFAAAAMPFTSPADNYLVAAFDLYRNYDGNGAVVGDTTIHATTTDDETSSVYAFAHSTDASSIEVVAINKTSSALLATLAIAHAPALTTATVYEIVDGAPAVVPAGGTAPLVVCASGSCTVAYAMPAMSASTLVLR